LKQEKLARLFGMNRGYIAQLLYTHKMRQLLIDAGVDENIGANISTRIIRQTQGLPKEEAINLLKISVEIGHASTRFGRLLEL